MKAPRYQRADMLQAVIDRSLTLMREPIDRIESIDGVFVVTAGRERLVLHCVWINDVSSDGRPLPGSGAWTARSPDDDLPPGICITSPPKQRRLSLWRKFEDWLRLSR